MNAVHLTLVIGVIIANAPPRSAQRSPICSGVPGGRSVRSSRSCSAYVRCANGRPHHFECPAGRQFNVRNSRCDAPDRVDCSECSRYGVQNIADPGGNCRRFVRCVRGFGEPRRCPRGLAWDGRLGDCTHRRDAACVSRPGAEVADDEDDDEEADSDGSVVSVCRKFRNQGVVQVGDRLDCRRFYICTNGGEQLLWCPVNMFYSTKLGGCEAFPSSCQREGALIVAAPPTPKPPANQAPPRPVDAPDCRLYVAQGVVFINDPNNCQRYFTCYRGDLAEHNCAPTTYYNPHTTKCEKACAGIKQVVVRPLGNSGQLPADSPPEPQQPSEPTSDKRCKRPEGNFPLATCYEYVHCEGGRVLYESSCIPDTYFVEADGRCVLDANGVCPQNNKPPPQQPQQPDGPAPDSRCLRRTVKFAAVTFSCTDYYVCHEGQVVVQLSCPADTYFHELNGPCRQEMSAACATRPIDPRCPQRSGNNPKANSCTQYYICSQGVVSSEQSCPNGQYFDATQRRCTSVPPLGCEPVSDPRCTAAIGYSAVDGGVVGGDCNRYVYCVASQVRSELQCFGSTPFFDDVLRQCTVSRPLSCAPVAVPVVEPTADVEPLPRCKRAAGYFREAGSCTKYVYCIKKAVRFEYECDGGWFFSESDGKCVPTKPSDCD